MVLQQRLIFYFFFHKKKNLFPLEEVSNSDLDHSFGVWLLIFILLLRRNYDQVIQLLQSIIFLCEKWK